MSDAPIPPREAEAIVFLQTLGKALHRYGAPANRLEEVLRVVAIDLGIQGSYFSTPTAIFYAFELPGKVEFVRLQRVHGHDLDLSKLARLDRLFNRVASGELAPGPGIDEVNAIVEDTPPYGPVLTLVSFALASAAAAPFFGGGPIESALSGACGLALGVTYFLTRGHENLRRLFELSGALVVSLVGLLLAGTFGASASTATLAGLIVLVPGFSLTIGATELAMNHPASGTARLAGAMTTLLMLTMGVILGTQIGTAILGFDPPDVVSVAMPAWFVPVSLLVAGLSLGVLFRTAPRDLPWSVVAVGLPWIAFKVGLGEIGREASIFVGAIIAGVFANLFARMFDRPSMIVRLPGILILVPGSASLLSLDAVAHGNAQLGVETLFRVGMTATALVAGFFASNVVLPPRKVL